MTSALSRERVTEKYSKSEYGRKHEFQSILWIRMLTRRDGAGQNSDIIYVSPLSQKKQLFYFYSYTILLYMLDVVSDDSFSTIQFPSSTSTTDIKDKYIYAALNSITYDKESCVTLCYTHTVSSTACNFFILYSGTCMLGNFQSTNTYTSPQDTFTAYFNKSE